MAVHGVLKLLTAAQEHSRIDLLQPHVYEETAGITLHDLLLRACGTNPNAVGEMFGRVLNNKSEGSLIRAMKEFQNEIRKQFPKGTVDPFEAFVKHGKNALRYQDLQIDCVTYCMQNQFSHNQFKDCPNVCQVLPVLRQELPPMQFSLKVIREISKHNWIPATNENNDIMENDDFAKMSQTNLALPQEGGPTLRVLAEICGGAANYKNVLEKVWQLEKALLYFACRDQWRQNKYPQPEQGFRALHVEEHCAFVALVFPFDGSGKTFLTRIMEEHGRALVLVNRMFHSGKLFFIVAPSVPRQLHSLASALGRMEIKQTELDATVGRMRIEQTELNATVGQLNATVGQLNATVGRMESFLIQIGRRLGLEYPQT